MSNAQERAAGSKGRNAFYSRQAAARSGTLIVLACGALLAVSVVVNLPVTTAPLAAAANAALVYDNEPVSPADGLVALSRLGYSAECLCAVGCENADVEALLTAMSTAGEDLAGFMAADQSCSEASASLDAVIGEIRRYGLTDTLAGQRSSAQSGLSAARGARDLAAAPLHEAVGDVLDTVVSEGAGQLALNYITNRDRRVPQAMRVLSLTGPQWSALESALAKIEGEGEELTGDETSVLAAVQSSPAVTLAAANLAEPQDQDSFMAAFDSAIVNYLPPNE